MNIEKWETLSSEYLYRRPWLTVRKDMVKLPNGVINPEHYVLEYPDWVNVIAITKEGKFVMIEQYRHGLDDVFIELPAGVIEPGETPLEGAKRELKEETGFGGGIWQEYTVVCQNPSICNNMTHCFLALDVEPFDTQHLEASEDIRVLLLSREEVITLLQEDKIKQSLMTTPLWKYFATTSGTL